MYLRTKQYNYEMKDDELVLFNPSLRLIIIALVYD